MPTYLPCPFFDPLKLTTLSRAREFTGLPLYALRAQGRAEFRRDPPKVLSRYLLIRMLAWRLQEKLLGGHDKVTTKLL